MPTLVTNDWFTSLGSGSNYPHCLVYANGYIWAGCQTDPGIIVQFNPLSPGIPLQTIQFPNDGAHKWVSQMRYIPSKGKIYALCGDANNSASVTTLVEIDPATGVHTDVITDASYSAGQGSFATDGTYLYIVSWYTNSVYKYRLSDWGFVTSLGTSLPSPHSMEYDSVTGNLFVGSASNFIGFPMVAQIAVSSFTLSALGFWDSDKIFSDDIAVAGGYVWFGSESTGNVVKFLATNVAATPTQIVTGIKNVGGNHGIFFRNFGIYFDGGVLWTGWEGNPGILGRITPATNLVELFQMPDINQASPNEWVRNGTNLYITGYTQPGWISQLTVTNYDGASAPSALQVSDTLSFSDAAALGNPAAPGVVIADTLVLRDSVGTSRVQANPLADTLAFSDSTYVCAAAVLAVSDTLSLSDNGGGVPLFFSDTLSLSDAVAFAVNLPALVSLTVSVSDTLRLFDSLSFVFPKNRVFITDSILLRDSARVIMGSVRDDYLRRYLNDVIRF